TDGATARTPFRTAPGSSAAQLVHHSLRSAADQSDATATGKKGRRRAAAAAAAAADGDDDDGGAGDDDALEWADDASSGAPPSKHRFASLPCASSTEHVHVPGLHVIPDFLSAAEEQSLLAAIDAERWIHPPHAHRMG